MSSVRDRNSFETAPAALYGAGSGYIIAGWLHTPLTRESSYFLDGGVLGLQEGICQADALAGPVFKKGRDGPSSQLQRRRNAL